jgi:hypothetical protein
MARHLPAFIHTLEDRGSLEFNILDDAERGFDNRFRIQKYVLHGVCLKGTFSPIFTAIQLLRL